MTTTRARSTTPRKRVSSGAQRTPPGKQGQTIPLVIPVPGGLARFRKPGDLTPRMTRDLEIIGAEIMPKIARLANASRIEIDGQLAAESSILNGLPIGLSREDMRNILEWQEAAAWAYLESWTLDRPLPETWEDMPDLPRDLYDALIAHAAKLATAPGGVGFTPEALPDDLDAADPDTPTSPSGASAAH